MCPCQSLRLHAFCTIQPQSSTTLGPVFPEEKSVPNPPRYNFEALCMEWSQNISPPQTNMETQKGPYKAYSPSKLGLYGFPLVWGSVFYLHLPRVPKLTLHPNPWSPLQTPDSITPDLHNTKPLTSRTTFKTQCPDPKP